ncbi:MAG: hypothetical protein LBR34_00765 [Prevotella sp.]|jgi:hypothetical protein|nr:hypothetical protein [Prevotella sp.]
MKRLLILIAACSFLTLGGLAGANVRWTPVKLGQPEIEYLKKDLQEKNKRYDPAAKMLFCVTQEKHYHSDLDSGVVVHQTRESLEYAAALLKTGDPVYMQRGVDIIRTVLPMQEKDPSLPYCGVWPYYPEDPLHNRKAAVDYNWADFIAVPLIDVIINHSDYMGKELVGEIKDALMLAACAIRRRNVQPDYTNVCIMGTYVCYIVGDICRQPEMTAYAQKRLKHFYDYTIRNGGFIEYNSPTYTLVAMDELLRMKQTIVRRQDKEMIDELYGMTWDLIARHFHRPSGQWCGPNLRAYSSLADSSFYRLLYNASHGKIEIQGNYLRIPNVTKPHRIPDSILPKFTGLPLPRTEIDTFVIAAPPAKSIVGKLYAGKTFALASVNQGYMWNQTRPLIAHWGTVEHPSYLRVRFLHDGYDFSAVNIACVQDTSTILAIFNVAADGGDTHPNLDRIQNATIEASDLRLRIEAGGNLSGVRFILPRHSDGFVTFASPDVQASIRIPYAQWDDLSGYWEQSAAGKTIQADYVLYAGAPKTFELNKLEEAVLGLYLSLSAAGDSFAPDNTNVQVDKNNDYLTLSIQQLMVKALAKPAQETRVKNDFEIRETPVPVIADKE